MRKNIYFLRETQCKTFSPDSECKWPTKIYLSFPPGSSSGPNPTAKVATLGCMRMHQKITTSRMVLTLTQEDDA